MWFERFVIVVPSLSHEFEPWQWSGYAPTWVDYAILLGSFGWFFMWFLLFIKQLPVMALAEIKEIVPPKMRARDPGGARSRPERAHDRSQPDRGGRLMQGVIGAFSELDSAVHAIEDLRSRTSTTSPSTRRHRVTSSRMRCRRRRVPCGASR